MKVIDLKNALDKLPNDLDIFITEYESGNVEQLGNCTVDVALVEKERNWHAEDQVYDPNSSADDADMSEEEWEWFKKAGTKIAVIWA